MVAAHTEDGGPGDPAPNSGALFVFEQDPTGTWNETQVLRASDAETDDQFGYSLSMVGNTLLVGANREDGGPGSPAAQAGAAYVFERVAGGAWTETQVLRASDRQGNDRFGCSVALGAGTLAVGARREDGGAGDPASDSGALYLFAQDASGTWNELEVVRASDAQLGDQFGHSLAASGNTFVVGALAEDGGPGDPTPDRGATYVLEVAPDPSDLDGDGFSTLCGDCNDAEPLVYPGAAEVCADGIDNDCDAGDRRRRGSRRRRRGPATSIATMTIPQRPRSEAEVCGDGIDNDCDAVADGRRSGLRLPRSRRRRLRPATWTATTPRPTA